MRCESRSGLLAELVDIIDPERTRCRFLSFHVTAEPGAGPVTLEVTAPQARVRCAALSEFFALQLPRGANAMIDIPTRATVAPTRSHRSGFVPSTHHIHTTATATYTPP